MALLAIGDNFTVHFVWQLPNGDYLRAGFVVEVLALDPHMERYTVRLHQFLGGRQESDRGENRAMEAIDKAYWAYLPDLVGCHLALAYEAADGRALRLKFETLTGAHTYFTRLER